MGETWKSGMIENTYLELKTILKHVEYVFLEKGSKLPIIIHAELKVEQKQKLLSVLEKHNRG